MNNFWTLFLGALCFFFFGLRLVEEGLRSALGDKLRTHIERLTRQPLQALFVGIVMTMLFQSSSATVLLLIGLASIGIVTVRQATPVVLGADIGTALIVLLLASAVHFDIRAVSLTVLIFAFVATFVLRKDRPKAYAKVFLGFGFVFYGLGMMSTANEPLGQSRLVQDVMEAILSNPWIAFIFATVLTGVVQKTAAVLGIVIAFAASGLLTAEGAVPFILGVNLGGTVLPFVGSLRARSDGRRIAYVHVGIKVVGVFVVMFFTGAVGRLAELWISAPSFQVAAIHIGFNVALAAVLLPFTSWIARLAKRWVPVAKEDRKFHQKYLDHAALESPGLAFANVFREILRMAEIAQEMFNQVLIPFEEAGRETMERLEEMDDQVDHLDREIKFYLAKVDHAQLGEEQARRQMELLTLTHDLEQIGDVINKEMMELADKKRRKNVSFSEEGWHEIGAFHRMVMENFRLAITALASGDIGLGKKVLRHKKHLGGVEQDYGQKHLLRLHQGLRESFDTSSIHLDLLSNLRRINSVICRMAYPVIDRREVDNA